MTAQRLTMTIAGLFILGSLAMGHINGQFDVTKFGWTWMLIFVGANLFQSGLTKFCPLTIILKKLGAK
jgi:hypothetical protein